MTRVPWLALVLALVLLPLGARAWEEERALAWIVAHSPLLQAQRAVTQAHQPPGGLRRVAEHTAVYARAKSLCSRNFWNICRFFPNGGGRRAGGGRRTVSRNAGIYFIEDQRIKNIFPAITPVGMATALSRSYRNGGELKP